MIQLQAGFFGGWEVVLLGVSCGIPGFLVGWVASLKNRNPWGWGIFGAVLLIPAIIALLILPSLCPRCKGPRTKAEAKANTCPRCGDVALTTT